MKNKHPKEALTNKSLLLKYLREYLHLSQTAFAKPLELSPTHISRLEKGISAVTDPIINKVCATFSVSKEYFYDNMPLSDAIQERKEPGFRLKFAREEKGWTQTELAEQSGVYASIISRVEAGAKLTEKQGIKLAEALEVGADWLMNGNEAHKHWPVDQALINWLWENEGIREELWEKMKNPPAK